MDEWTTWILLAGGGLVAGVINTLAGGGSLITMPLLVLIGLPATTANGTNRIGVLFQNLVSTWRFRREGLDGLRGAAPVLLPVLLGSVVGASIASQISADLYRQVFGVAMIGLLYPMLRGSRAGNEKQTAAPRSRLMNALTFFGIGLYGGALQAGVGLFLIAALARSGLDLVRANSIKVVIVGALTLVAVPVFIAHGQVDWKLASALVVGFAMGGELGARATIRGGERLIRPVLVLAVIALSGRMLGVY
ncbi:MAG: sulfite exporter TauE/SafE family protein [bacterium]|nr:sulfite exporter TauE/SafE family protein [bacterium]